MATITICDRCGSKEGAVRRFFWDGGHQPDPAGGRREETGEHKDICEHCELVLLRVALAKIRKMTEFRSDVDRIIAHSHCAHLNIPWKGVEINDAG